MRREKFTIKQAGYGAPVVGESPFIALELRGSGNSPRTMRLMGDHLDLDVHVRGLMMAVGVQEWQGIAGRSVLLTLEDKEGGTRVTGVEPLPGEPGEIYLPFKAMAFERRTDPERRRARGLEHRLANAERERDAYRDASVGVVTQAA